MKHNIKFGQPVSVNMYLKRNTKIIPNDEPEHIPVDSIEIASDEYEFNAYSPYNSHVSGIVTGYKQLTTKISYKIVKGEYFDQTIPTWIKEPVYVVQNTLNKKYYVKKEWLQEQEALNV